MDEDKNNEREGAKRSQSQKFEKEERKRKEERRERKYITTLRLRDGFCALFGSVVLGGGVNAFDACRCLAMLVGTPIELLTLMALPLCFMSIVSCY